MGYRFSLETASTVANLTFGRVRECFEEILSSDECYWEFMSFIEIFSASFVSDRKEVDMNIVRNVKEAFYRLEVQKREFKHVDIDELIQYSTYSEPFYALKDFSDILSRCKLKSLLLPPMDNNNDEQYSFMTSIKTFKNLMNIHKGDSCLILQPLEKPEKALIFNPFPNFEVALRQADLWPAVLFWDSHGNYAFVPVKSEKQLISLYKYVKIEENPVKALQNLIADKKELADDELQHGEKIIEPINPSYNIIHLSDLHFGANDEPISVSTAERRLRSLIKSQLSKFRPEDKVSIVITGDAVDSPDETMETYYQNFAEQLENQCGQMPIRILGNHDVNPKGIRLTHYGQYSKTAANAAGVYPKIEIIEDVKVILLLFNSNTDGIWAEGKIGQKQMSEMGNLLDAVKNVEDYTLIAVLHHHLVKIPKPDYYEKRWFEKFVSDDFMEMTLKLLDAQLFLQWLQRRKVKIVLHGHKHIPYVTKQDGITIIGCGSSTGQIVHTEKEKTCISYNVLKITRENVTCTQYAEQVIGAGADVIKTEVIDIS